jgi:DNA polymerase-1
MYTKFNVAGAATGRFTSSGGDLENGFNAQQIPRQFQKLFKADTDTTTVIGLDYATLELRLACAIFGEDEMYKQLLAGEDIHTSMAQMITGKPLHPDGLQGDKNAKSGMADVVYDYVTHKDRTDAKAVNFGYVFGMSAATYMNYAFVSYGIKVTLDEAKLLRERYFTKYPNFGAYHKNVWNNYSKPSFVYTTALGRRVKPRLGTDAINGPVQGSGAETTKLAAHWLIRNDCERLGLDYKTEWEQCEVVKYLFNVVHDAIYLRVPKDAKDFWNEQLKVAMVRGWEEISKAPLLKYKDIPMPVDE